jgi:murein DD-endopeptidase MepM/ murein hydrolase activator NlpD
MGVLPAFTREIKGRSMNFEKRRKTNNGRFTFILIPSITGTPIQLSLPRKYLQFLIVAGALFIAAFVIVTCLYYGCQTELRQVYLLKQDNQKKEETIQLMNEEINRIKQQQVDIESKQQQIKQLMGIKTEASITPSRGGEGGVDLKQLHMWGESNFDTLATVQSIITQLDYQEKELDQWLAKVNQEAEYFRSLPNQWPVEGSITSPYGWRKNPFGGSLTSFHNGIDIANNVGTPVLAAGDGVVISAGWQGAYGKMVVIDHGYGIKTKYGHNSSIKVNVGDKVKKGQVIALLGNTGRSTGPHVHFTVEKGGNTQDPLIYLPSR